MAAGIYTVLSRLSNETASQTHSWLHITFVSIPPLNPLSADKAGALYLLFYAVILMMVMTGAWWEVMALLRQLIDAAAERWGCLE